MNRKERRKRGKKEGRKEERKQKRKKERRKGGRKIIIKKNGKPQTTTAVLQVKQISDR